MKSKEICELKLKDSIAFPILRSIDKSSVERKIGEILEDKKLEVEEFSIKHSLQAVGIRMTLTPNKITCSFVVSTRENLELSNEDIAEFIDIFSDNFELANEEDKNKFLGYPSWFNCDKEDLKVVYNSNIDIFKEIENILEHSNSNVKNYFQNIESYFN